MGANKYSETGAAEDMIRSFVQFGAAEIHAMNLYYKTTAEMDNGLIDIENNEVLQKHLDKAEQYRKDIETYANLRRSVMRSLFEMFDGDKDTWCLVKHLGIGAMTIFEAYEASDNNLELLNLAYEANKAFTEALSRFLGIEITDCAACFADAMKGVSKE